MDIFAVLNSVADLRAKLETYHFTTSGLLIVAALAAVGFIFSAREVLGWFLRTNHLRDEVRALRAQVDSLERSLNKKDEQEEPEDAKTFRLDHWRKSL